MSELYVYNTGMGNRWENLKIETNEWSKPTLSGKKHVGYIYVTGVVVGPFVCLMGGFGYVFGNE